MNIMTYVIEIHANLYQNTWKTHPFINKKVLLKTLKNICLAIRAKNIFLLVIDIIWVCAQKTGSLMVFCLPKLPILTSNDL